MRVKVRGLREALLSSPVKVLLPLLLGFPSAATYASFLVHAVLFLFYTVGSSSIGVPNPTKSWEHFLTKITADVHIVLTAF